MIFTIIGITTQALLTTTQAKNVAMLDVLILFRPLAGFMPGALSTGRCCCSPTVVRRPTAGSPKRSPG
ncbi:MAG: hypothetical protein R2861_00730 [Desulfobacterales bacterium]